MICPPVLAITLLIRDVIADVLPNQFVQFRTFPSPAFNTGSTDDLPHGVSTSLPLAKSVCLKTLRDGLQRHYPVMSQIYLMRIGREARRITNRIPVPWVFRIFYLFVHTIVSHSSLCDRNPAI